MQNQPTRQWSAYEETDPATCRKALDDSAFSLPGALVGNIT